MATIRERTAALSVLEVIQVKGEPRDLVGRRTCPDCGQQANIIRGKVRLYTMGCACGMKPGNGTGFQERLLSHCEPVAAVEEDPAPVIETDPARDPAPTRQAGFLHWFLNLQVLP